jgi:hypothetical protein
LKSSDQSKIDKQEIESKIEYYTYEASPHGITYGAWTVRWWKWWFSISRARNPAQDQTGIYANLKQTRPTWFLAGTWVQKDRQYPYRRCSIPSGVSILFPVINCEENTLEYPDLLSDEAMRARLLQDVGTVKDFKCIINEKAIPPQLVESDPKFFEIRIRKDMSESKRGGKTRMTASGYWVFLRPLPEGNFHISFEGSYQYGRLYTGAYYDITIGDRS